MTKPSATVEGQNMASFDFDLFVIGGGSGGVRAARMAAQRGARVALAERGGTEGLGGTCVNVGCIPKKLYSYAAQYGEGFEQAHGYGWEGQAFKLNWGTLKANRKREISRLNGIYLNLLTGAGVRVMNAHARLTGPHEVQVDGESWSAKHILVATGGTPHMPEIVGSEWVVNSNAMFDLEPFPQRLLVVGGGYIACEFASIFNGLGASVTQLYRGEQVLRGFDDDVRHFLAAELRKAGVDLRLVADVGMITKTVAALEVLITGHRPEPYLLTVDTILYATGRVPNTQGMGLREQGVVLGRDGAIVIDDNYRTSVPSIYALGDVTARVQLTPVALGEAMVLVDHLFGPAAGKSPRNMSYRFIPTAVFTHPSVGTVGYSETDARAQFGAVTVYRSEFKTLKHTLSGSSERTLMKLVVEDATDRVVGLHMVGADAGDIVQGFAVAMKAGATKAMFDGTIGIHPTAAEEFVTMREPVKSAG